ncbi:mucin-4-like isoform X2 [Ostrea edulis]|uniref:mucin-4-like isoform X2 n=1 Tax=Ostrea edulis TaxID=37623 RepID=UPI0024AEE750|nr:mucin-4-like isoform X2 [Ostrea edulis]
MKCTVPLFLFLVSFTGIIYASHFRGGIFTWEHISGTQVRVTHRMSWRKSAFDCDQAYIDNRTNRTFDSISCYSGCSSTTWNRPSITSVCTDFSTSEDWATYEGEFTTTFPLSTSYVIGYSSCCWIGTLQVNPSSSWSIVTHINLAYRSDIGRVNKSPVTAMQPIVRLQRGCSHTIQIPVADDDGDTVRCRWATNSPVNECAGICQSFPNAVLDETTCTIDYSSTTNSNGYYGVAIQIEDFATSSSTTPISSIPLQFLVEIFDSNSPCAAAPTFISPTPADNGCFEAVQGITFSIEIRIRTGTNNQQIREVTTQSPIGVTKSSIQAISLTDYYINLIWTPTSSQQGSYIICFTGEDNLGLTTDTRCIRLNAVSSSTLPLVMDGSQSPSGFVHGDNHQWSVRYSNYFVPPTAPTYIRIYGFNGLLVEIIDVTSSSVVYPQPSSDNRLSFNTSYNYQKGISYYIQFDEGVANRELGCSVKSTAIISTSFWNFTIYSIRCSDSPCNNSLNCTDLVGDYECMCIPGFTGKNCTIDVDECSSGPCKNNATCIDGRNSFTCNCYPGFYGENCTERNLVRLVDGKVPFEGRVEIYNNGMWGTVCDDFWDHNDAAVVCGMLGYSRNSARGLCCEVFGKGGPQIWLDNVDCQGTEQDIFHCQHIGWGNHNCDNHEDAAVICSPKDIPVRLVGGQNPLEGRVELYYNGGWGTVCDDYWDDHDTAVVCNSLGFSANGATAMCCAHFGQGNGSILLDDVDCLGTETDIEHCKHRGWGLHNCQHQEDVSVRCSPITESTNVSPTYSSTASTITTTTQMLTTTTKTATTPISGSTANTDTTTTPISGSTTNIYTTTTPISGSTTNTDTTTTLSSGSTTNTDTTTSPISGSTTDADTTTSPISGSTTNTDTTTSPISGLTINADTTTTPISGSTTNTDTTTTPISGSTTNTDTTTSPISGSTTNTDTTTSPISGLTTNTDTTTSPISGLTINADTTTTPISGSTTNTDTTTTPISGSTTNTDTTTSPISGSTTNTDTTTTPISGSTTNTDTTTSPISGSTTNTDTTTTPISGSTTEVDKTTTLISGSTINADTTTSPISGSTINTDTTTTPISGSTTEADKTTTPISGSTTKIDSTSSPISDSATSTNTTSIPISGSTTNTKFASHSTSSPQNTDSTITPTSGSTTNMDSTSLTPTSDSAMNNDTTSQTTGSTNMFSAPSSTTGNTLTSTTNQATPCRSAGFCCPGINGTCNSFGYRLYTTGIGSCYCDYACLSLKDCCIDFPDTCADLIGNVTNQTSTSNSPYTSSTMDVSAMPSSTEASTLHDASTTTSDMPSSTEAATSPVASTTTSDMPSSTEAATLHDASTTTSNMPSSTEAATSPVASTTTSNMPSSTEAATSPVASTTTSNMPSSTEAATLHDASTTTSDMPSSTEAATSPVASTTTSEMLNPIHLNSSVRLVGGPTPYEGRVEVYHAGVWGTVCDDIWNDRLSAVVCRSLGFPWNTSESYCCSRYGQGTGVIWMDNVYCIGNEERIELCSHNGWGNHNCVHYEDVSVNCLPDIATTSPANTTTLTENTGTSPVYTTNQPINYSSSTEPTATTTDDMQDTSTTTDTTLEVAKNTESLTTNVIHSPATDISTNSPKIQTISTIQWTTQESTVTTTQTPSPTTPQTPLTTTQTPSPTTTQIPSPTTTQTPSPTTTQTPSPTTRTQTLSQTQTPSPTTAQTQSTTTQTLSQTTTQTLSQTTTQTPSPTTTQIPSQTQTPSPTTTQTFSTTTQPQSTTTQTPSTTTQPTSTTTQTPSPTTTQTPSTTTQTPSPTTTQTPSPTTTQTPSPTTTQSPSTTTQTPSPTTTQSPSTTTQTQSTATQTPSPTTTQTPSTTTQTPSPTTQTPSPTTQAPSTTTQTPSPTTTQTPSPATQAPSTTTTQTSSTTTQPQSTTTQTPSTTTQPTSTTTQTPSPTTTQTPSTTTQTPSPTTTQTPSPTTTQTPSPTTTQSPSTTTQTPSPTTTQSPSTTTQTQSTATQTPSPTTTQTPSTTTTTQTPSPTTTQTPSPTTQAPSTTTTQTPSPTTTQTPSPATQAPSTTTTQAPSTTTTQTPSPTTTQTLSKTTTQTPSPATQAPSTTTTQTPSTTTTRTQTLSHTQTPSPTTAQTQSTTTQTQSETTTQIPSPTTTQIPSQTQTPSPTTQTASTTTQPQSTTTQTPSTTTQPTSTTTQTPSPTTTQTPSTTTTHSPSITTQTQSTTTQTPSPTTRKTPSPTTTQTPSATTTQSPSTTQTKSTTTQTPSTTTTQTPSTTTETQSTTTQSPSTITQTQSTTTTQTPSPTTIKTQSPTTQTPSTTTTQSPSTTTQTQSTTTQALLPITTQTLSQTQAPPTTTQAPSTTTQTPSPTTTQTPSQTTTQTPSTKTQSPSTTIQTQSTTRQIPSPTTTQTPSTTTTQTPSPTTTQTPSPTTTQTPSTTTAQSPSTTQIQSTTTQSPSPTTTQTPSPTTTQTPSTTTAQSLSTTQIQSTTTQYPSTTTTQFPSTTTQTQSTTTTQTPSPTTTQTPLPTTQAPSTTTQNPSPTTTQTPSPTTQAPSTTTQTPSPTTTQTPSPTTTQTPSPTTTQTPSPTTQAPSTTTQAPSPTTTQTPSPPTTQTPSPTTTQTPSPTTTQTPSTTTTTQTPSTTSMIVQTTDSTTQVLETLGSFTFGEEVYDWSVSGDDVTSPALNPPTHVYIGDGTEGTFDKAYVGSNGIISLGERYNSFSIYDLTSSSVNQRRIICPFWTDLISGNIVYYNTYTSGVWSDQPTLDKANSIIREYYGDDFPHFEAIWVLKVTWKDMDLYSDRTQNVTVQAVLVTDGINTFTMFYYIDVNLAVVNGLDISVGYRYRSFYTSNPYSCRSGVFTLSQIPGNRGIRGFWIYKLTTEIQYSGNELSCFNWYIRNKNQGMDTILRNRRQWWSNVCPCQLDWLLFDGRFQYSRTDFANGVICYASMMSFTGSAECCYPISNWWFGWSWWSIGWFGSTTRTWTRPAAGTLLENSPFFDTVQYYNEDLLPKEQCCGTGHCDWYYEVRPRTWCYRVSIFWISWLFGDPHINTLDGNQYTFNGYDEYVLLRIDTEAKQFELQARTDLAEGANGTVINATIFSAFAARDETGSFVQVELSRSKDKMYIRGNDQDITNSFEDDISYRYFTRYLVITKENQTYTATFLNSSITMKVTLGVRFLTIEAVVDSKYNGSVIGLMGNFDGNSTNDFILPNGTFLKPEDVNTERKIYNNFGQFWVVNETTSIFHYGSGLSHRDYSHPEFVPFFVDEYPEDQRNASREACGGDSASQACIFDYLATGDKALALSSGNTDTSNKQDLVNIENQPPFIDGEEVIHAEVNKTVQIQFNASDDKGYTYQVLNQPPTGFSFDNITGVATWTPNDSNNAQISITVVDTDGVSAPAMDIILVVCSACSHRGYCDYNRTVQSTNSTFRLATCVCYHGYTGDNCELDADACADSPCPLGRNCTDLPAEEELRIGRGYNCTDCPRGYQDIDNKCQDINECNTTSTNQCDQVCENTEGGFECHCFNGYRMSEGSCRDIDECSEGTSTCEQNCRNTDGSYVCSCVTGFELKKDNSSCLQIETDVCKLVGLSCQYACDNSSGIFKCICPAGYELAANNRNCTNINECDRNICSQHCTDTNGSYNCACYIGYRLNSDHTTCSECDAPYYGQGCSYMCECGAGMDRCDPVKGCVCLPGWTGSDCSQDVNECSVNQSICGTDKLCHNLQGGYRCDCRQGYRKEAGKCVDVDECANAGSHNCSTATSTCKNKDGGFSCECKTGYIQKNLYECQDIDECGANIDGCSQICSNVNGSYDCDCHFGFSLNDDRKTCSKVQDTCLLFPGLNCSYGCKQAQQNQTIGLCFCPEGYILNEQDKSSCIDLNECANMSLNKCSQKDTCVNTPGSFNCSCPEGTYLENDGRTCRVCDGFSYGMDCQTPCECGVGASHCDPVRGCLCKSGWIGTKCDADIDECMAGNPCNGTHQVCRNTPGSYVCVCQNGYVEASGTCNDVDECVDRPCSQLCMNTPGSFFCNCYSGFHSVNGNLCGDIDECSLPVQPCDQVCTNTIGSYKCSCHAGYLLNTTNRKDCYAKTECSNGTVTCAQKCGVHADGSEYCFCDNGYFIDTTDNRTCLNRDDCSPNPCSQTCVEKAPGQGYSCLCENGKMLDDDQRTCIECSNWRFGPNCSSQCTCNNENSLSCDPVSGECTCKPGWSGTNCESDIDECRQSSTCPVSSTCVNSLGSYTCVCDNGSVMAGGTCVECSGHRYGLNCGLQCQCNEENTMACDKRNGTCNCRGGWTGLNCSVDVHECSLTPSICGANAKCTEEIGSFSCQCDPGFQKTSSNTCSNIDECVTGSHSCHVNSRCMDTSGGYICTCDPGFSGDGHTCSDVNECSSPSVCDPNSKCNNTWGSYVCTCDPGFIGDGKNCSDVDECLNEPPGCHPDALCNNTAGSFSCQCKSGYEGDGKMCKDIDECLRNLSSCDTHALCTNTNGSHTCACKSGFYGDGQTCLEKDECAENIHSCHVNASCINTFGNYFCECNPGFFGSGRNCTDVDECLDGSNDCHLNATCHNTVGNFSCMCDIGFHGNGVNCYKCPNMTFGVDCQNQCTCNTSNTRSCDKVTGACACKIGWNGDTCSEDIPECTEKPDTCGLNAICSELPGSYSCSCMTGYQMTTNNDCQNVDECNTQQHNCHPNAHCNDTVGHFLCACKSGFSGNGTSCTAIPLKPSISDTTDDKYRIKIRFDMNTNQTTLDVHYMNTVQRMTTALASFYQATIPGFQRVVILHIRIGSLIVDHQLVTSKSHSDQQKTDITKALQRLASGTVNIVYDGREQRTMSVELQNSESSNFVNISSTSLCTIYQALQPCQEGQKCSETNGNIACSPLTTSDNYMVIVGLGVGIPFGIITILGLSIVYFYLKKRRGQREPKPDYDSRSVISGNSDDSLIHSSVKGITKRLDTTGKRGPFSLHDESPSSRETRTSSSRFHRDF